MQESRPLRRVVKFDCGHVCKANVYPTAAMFVHAASQGLLKGFRGRFLTVVQIPVQPEKSIDDDSGEENTEPVLKPAGTASITFSIASESKQVSVSCGLRLLGSFRHPNFMTKPPFVL